MREDFGQELGELGLSFGDDPAGLYQAFFGEGGVQDAGVGLLDVLVEGVELGVPPFEGKAGEGAFESDMEEDDLLVFFGAELLRVLLYVDLPEGQVEVGREEKVLVRVVRLVVLH